LIFNSNTTFDNNSLSGLKEYFEFYNFERPHQSLVGKTPAEIYWGREVARKAA